MNVTNESIVNAMGNRDSLHSQLKSLTELMLEKYYQNWEFDVDQNMLVQETVDYCIKKSQKFDLDNKKAKIFNYFTTIIMCFLRQVMRKQRYIKR